MPLRTSLRAFGRALGLSALVIGLLAQGQPAMAFGMTHVTGHVLTPTGQPAANIWVCLQVCPAATQTDANGNFAVDILTGGITWNFVYVSGGQAAPNGGVGGTQVGQQLGINPSGTTYTLPDYTLTTAPGGGGGGGGGGGCPAIPAAHTGTATQTTYLPNVTKTLGGATGYQTPFIVQNIGVANTDLQVDFFTFANGTLVARRIVPTLKPGTSFADVPDNDCDLTDNTQFSVVVSSFGAPVAAVVNQVAGTGASAVSASYVGTASGATSVFLPNITKRFFGFDAPFIIQNLGAASTTATASFVSFDRTKTATIQRTIAPGQSQAIDPNAEATLVDGTQYAVTVTSAQPISVVANIVNDPASAPPVFLAMNGLGPAGGGSLYAPYVVKNQMVVSSSVSTVVVQNLGTGASTPSLTFTPLGGGASTTLAGPSTAAGASWAFDIRYQGGDTTKSLCGAAASTGCLGDGSYSVVASGGQLGAVVNIVGPTSADSYTALGKASSKFYLPNVTRTLGGTQGWSTPLVVQSVNASNVSVSWYKFSDGSLVTTQSLSLSPGSAQVVDPRNVTQLADNSQYSVIVDGNGGSVAAIVTELNFQGGDGAMIYEGFAQ